MGLTEKHWFENEDVPENYEWALEDAVILKKQEAKNPESNPKYWLATQILDVFTKTFCIKRDSEDLEFECKICPFQNVDGTCRVKMFKYDLCPEYKNFGAMSH